jgi:hypothetical protein
MQQFVELLQGWQVFYATLAAACATLIGLLFIALTFHPSFLRDKRNRWQLRIARKTFADLLLVLLTSLMFLVPKLPPTGLAVALFALGASWSLGDIGRVAAGAKRDGVIGLSRLRTIRGFILSFVGGVGLIGVAVAIWFGYTDVLYWLVAVLAALLASAGTTAWALLTEETPVDRRGKSGREKNSIGSVAKRNR